MERRCQVVAGEITAAQLYAILRLRAEVFVVEQRCLYVDPDGRDLEPSTRHLWVESEGGVIAALRVLAEPDGGTSIGRVVTAPGHRARGVGGRLVRAALASAPPGPVRLNAQSYLVDWYRRLGFVVVGAEFDEDGIPHTPMALAAAS